MTSPLKPHRLIASPSPHRPPSRVSTRSRTNPKPPLDSKKKFMQLFWELLQNKEYIQAEQLLSENRRRQGSTLLLECQQSLLDFRRDRECEWAVRGILNHEDSHLVFAAYFIKSLQLYHSKDFKASLQFLQAYQKFNQCQASSFLKAKILVKLEKPEQALTHLQLMQTEGQALLLRGECLRRLRKFNEAVQMFQLAFQQLQTQKVFLKLLQAFLYAEKYQQLIQTLQLNQSSLSKHADLLARVIQIKALHRLGRHHSKIDVLLNILSQTDLGSEELILSIAKLNFGMMGDVHGTINFLDKNPVNSKGIQATKQFFETLLLQSKAQHKQALQSYKKLQNSGLPSFFATLIPQFKSYSLLALNRLAEGSRLLIHSENLSKGSKYNLNLAQGILRVREGNLERAHKQFELAAQHSGRLQQALLFKAVATYLQHTELDFHQNLQALQTLKTVILNDPSLANAHLLATLVNLQKKNLEAAQEALKSFSAFSQTNKASFLEIRSLYELAKGNFLQAMHSAQKLGKLANDPYFPYIVQIYALNLGSFSMESHKLIKKLLHSKRHANLAHQLAADSLLISCQFRNAIRAYSYSQPTIQIILKQVACRLKLGELEQSMAILTNLADKFNLLDPKLSQDIKAVHLLLNIVKGEQFPVEQPRAAGYLFSYSDICFYYVVFSLQQGGKPSSLLRKCFELKRESEEFYDCDFMQSYNAYQYYLAMYCCQEEHSLKDKLLQIGFWLQETNLLGGYSVRLPQTYRYGECSLPVRKGNNLYYLSFDLPSFNVLVRFVSRDMLRERVKRLNAQKWQMPWVRKHGDWVVFTNEQCFLKEQFQEDQ